jgi:hypothetical protein
MRGRPCGAWLEGRGPSLGGIGLNDVELYMSIQLATALLAIFAGLIPHVGWAIRKLIPTFVALQATSDNTFLRTQALDALSFGIAQKEALACLYLIEEGPQEAHYTSMGELANAALIRFIASFLVAKGLLMPALTTWLL